MKSAIDAGFRGGLTPPSPGGVDAPGDLSSTCTGNRILKLSWMGEKQREYSISSKQNEQTKGPVAKSLT